MVQILKTATCNLQAQCKIVCVQHDGWRYKTLLGDAGNLYGLSLRRARADGFVGCSLGLPAAVVVACRGFAADDYPSCPGPGDLFGACFVLDVHSRQLHCGRLTCGCARRRCRPPQRWAQTPRPPGCRRPGGSGSPAGQRRGQHSEEQRGNRGGGGQGAQGARCIPSACCRHGALAALQVSALAVC